MVGANVVTRSLDDLALAVTADHVPALTGDLLAHVAPFVVIVRVVRLRRWAYVGGWLAGKVQLCGRFVVELDSLRVEHELPGRQGRVLLAYLVSNRLRTITRDELPGAVWADGHDGGLAPLLSKLRRIVPLDGLHVDVEPLRVDVEDAVEAVHRAESALAQEQPHEAWGPSQVAMFVCGRPFLPGESGDWIEAERGRVAELHVRALEAYGRSTLGIGGTELTAAVRAGRTLVALEPYRESGHRLLMEAFEREGNSAQALLVYEALRSRLRDDLGISPSAETQSLHRRLLR
jgi:SARP family transcriptional regulator, regulator of embCAB operon